MAAAISSLNGDCDLLSAKKFQKSKPPSSSAMSILHRKRSFVDDVQSPTPSPAKKIRFGDHMFFQNDNALTKPFNLPNNMAEWVELTIKEIMGAISIDDAKSRATIVLDNLEKSMASAQTNSETAAQTFQERIEILAKENFILKRGIAIQHQRQKEYHNKSEEVNKLKELVGKYQEQVKSLEMNNYALKMHLQQAIHSKSTPARFHRDVF